MVLCCVASETAVLFYCVPYTTQNTDAMNKAPAKIVHTSCKHPGPGGTSWTASCSAVNLHSQTPYSTYLCRCIYNSSFWWIYTHEVNHSTHSTGSIIRCGVRYAYHSRCLIAHRACAPLRDAFAPSTIGTSPESRPKCREEQLEGLESAWQCHLVKRMVVGGRSTLSFPLSRRASYCSNIALCDRVTNIFSFRLKI